MNTSVGYVCNSFARSGLPPFRDCIEKNHSHIVEVRVVLEISLKHIEADDQPMIIRQVRESAEIGHEVVK
jgi:hypothetical protein